MIHKVKAEPAFGGFMLTATAKYLRVPFADNSLIPICHWAGLLLILLDSHQGNPKAVIHDESQYMKTIREMVLHDDTIVFLDELHALMKANGASNLQSPYKSLFFKMLQWEIALYFFTSCLIWCSIRLL